MSSVLKNSDIAGDIQSFKLPMLEADGRAARSKYRMPSAKEVEDVYKSAYDEGYARGTEAASKMVQERVRTQLASLDSILDSIYRPVDDAENELITVLAQISVNIAANIIRREIRQDPGQIAAVVAEGIKLLPLSTEQITLVLAPEDARFIQEAYQDVEHPYSWKIREDPSITQGGCLIVTESSTIDARLETRLNDLCFQMLGGTRKTDTDIHE